jgi:hypothetical protein
MATKDTLVVAGADECLATNAITASDDQVAAGGATRDDPYRPTASDCASSDEEGEECWAAIAFAWPPSHAR